MSRDSSSTSSLPLPLALNPSKGDTEADRLCATIENGDIELFRKYPLICPESLDSVSTDACYDLI